MKKNLFVTGFALCIFCNTWAGGLLTNTNQSTHFLRNPARGASIEIDAAYTNPAGLAFLQGEGFFFSINNQSAFQKRTITTTYAPFAGYGGSATKVYEGTASAPVIPSIQAAYKSGNWTLSGEFAVTGGGGKATFNKGLPSFESSISLLPSGITQLGGSIGGLMPGATLTADQYSVNAYMEGSSIIYGAQLGGTYAISQHFAAYAGFRMNFVNNSYVGHLLDIKTNPTSNKPDLLGTGAMISASAYFSALAQMQGLPDDFKNQLLARAASTADKQLDCSQTGWGVTPIIGIDFNYNKLNIGLKYELNTHLNVENKTKIDGTGLFSDGVNTPSDIPALLTIGAQYAVIEPVTISVGYHHFFDANAKMANDKQKNINGGINEYLAGVEWRINKLFLISTGGQITRTGVTDAYQSDLSYSLHSSSICIGGAVDITKNVRINIGYLYSFYQDWTRNNPNYAGTTPALPATEVFGRTNKTFGAGVDFWF
ncbi:MAG: aromatic hydrocarbon degradation protein [Candidatus Symbiothrix sp.]|jgi:long-chain fatty acid transport protein|nr:aromatic hydrocarbon degradation protein [Candidatus Symbiothrix sp.]